MQHQRITEQIPSRQSKSKCGKERRLPLLHFFRKQVASDFTLLDQSILKIGQSHDMAPRRSRMRSRQQFSYLPSPQYTPRTPLYVSSFLMVYAEEMV